jgi:hypothetical protein
MELSFATTHWANLLLVFFPNNLVVEVLFPWANNSNAHFSDKFRSPLTKDTREKVRAIRKSMCEMEVLPEKEAFKKEVWTQLIKERKIGYFALLRNLRNILEQAPDLVPLTTLS